MKRVVVIGAGVGGLTTAAVLARAGLEVTVLEANVYAGGCAGTFYHQGYRFDAGATLSAGFYTGGPMDLVARAAGIPHWSGRETNLAMCVHLPDGTIIPRYSDDLRKQVQQTFFTEQDQVFWDWQERTADALWNLALRLPAWPPQGIRQMLRLLRVGSGWLLSNLGSRAPGLVTDAFQPVAAHLSEASERMRLFIDAQLLISAQTTSNNANALYAASALDLPRRGVFHLAEGMGSISQEFVQAVRRNGGQVLFRKQATRIILDRGHPHAVETHREVFPADLIVANLTPWDLRRLLGQEASHSLRKLPTHPEQGWGAFTVYAGIDGSVVPHQFPVHHQVILREPFGEGNTIFLSISPDWDLRRSPKGCRAVTISTHTNLNPWWANFENDRTAYEARKKRLTQSMLQAAEKILPGLREAAKLVLPGTPVTFQRFTNRDWGWVGGFPQTNLFHVWGPRQQPGIWMVGDCIFPGQSTAAVALGGLRVAYQILDSISIPEVREVPPESSYLATGLIPIRVNEGNPKDS